MNIGILQSAGVAGDIIQHAFSHPELSDVVTPVIYSKENKNDKNVSSDLKFGNISAIVVAPGSSTEFSFEGAMTVYVDGRRRLVTLMPDVELSDVYNQLNAETLSAQIRKACHSLCRDFLVTTPRVALISLNRTPDAAEKDILEPVVAELQQQKIGISGPYSLEEYIQQNMYQHFDMTLTICDAHANQFLNTVMLPGVVRLTASLPMVMTSTNYPATYDFQTDFEGPAQSLRDAVYLAMDVCRCRQMYDTAHQSPLPKLYHERHEDGDKARFTVTKK